MRFFKFILKSPELRELIAGVVIGALVFLLGVFKGKARPQGQAA